MPRTSPLDAMILQVESRNGLHGDIEPHSFALGGTRIEVLSIIDRWFGEDCFYFKVHASDKGLYILRYTPTAREWELALYQASVAPPRT